MMSYPTCGPNVYGIIQDEKEPNQIAAVVSADLASVTATGLFKFCGTEGM